jgi:hypothetical protein
MARDIRDVVAEIDTLAPANADDLDLDRLQSLAEEYFSLVDAPAHLDVWFRLYERFPDSDGHGVFWSILHGIEAQPDSEKFVVASVRRNPTRFPVLMVNSMLNAGISEAGGSSLLEVLRSVATDERALPGVRRDAEQFLQHQRGRAK